MITSTLAAFESFTMALTSPSTPVFSEYEYELCELVQPRSQNVQVVFFSKGLSDVVLAFNGTFKGTFKQICIYIYVHVAITVCLSKSYAV